MVKNIFYAILTLILIFAAYATFWIIVVLGVGYILYWFYTIHNEINKESDT